MGTTSSPSQSAGTPAMGLVTPFTQPYTTPEEVEAMIEAALGAPADITLQGRAWQELVLPANTGFVRLSAEQGPAQIYNIRLAEPPPDGHLLRLAWELPGGLTRAGLQRYVNNDVPDDPNTQVYYMMGELTSTERTEAEKRQKEAEEKFAKNEVAKAATEVITNYPWGFPPLGTTPVINKAGSLVEVSTLLLGGKFMWVASAQAWVYTH